ncbi:GlxA family transcriptional regulator [Azospirillum endophyticum]
MRVAILALDGVFDTGLTVLMDVFSTTNELAAAHGIQRPPIEVSLVGLRERVRTAQGFEANVNPLDSVRKPDWIVVPALNAKMPLQVEAALERNDVREAAGQLSVWRTKGYSIAGACVGTFILGEAGILDGREATTTWSLAPLFRQRFPNVNLDETRMIAGSEGTVTAGAAMGHLDLALWLVRLASPDLASLVAKMLLIDKRPSQARYIMPNYLAHADPLVERFERWARDHLADGFSLDAAAAALAVGPRTLQRRTEAVVGRSPLAFFQDLRVERAEHLLSIGRRLEDIASEVGYADAGTLRALIRRRLGRGVRDLRTEIKS